VIKADVRPGAFAANDLFALEQVLKGERRLVARIVRLDGISSDQGCGDEQRFRIEDDTRERTGSCFGASDQL
jgi:hypothetical protein